MRGAGVKEGCRLTECEDRRYKGRRGFDWETREGGGDATSAEGRHRGPRSNLLFIPRYLPR